MPQDLIGCQNHRKLKALIPRVAVALKIFANDPPSAEIIILLSFSLFYGFVVVKYALICAVEIKKNSDGFPYLLKTDLLNLRN